jgi:hypothetical protein
LSDIGVKLGVEGESEFKNALKEINTNLKTLGTEMKAVTSAFDRNDTSIENLSEQNKVLNKQIDEQKNKLGLLKAKLAEAAAEYGENDAKTQKWQQQVNLATAALNKSELQLKNNISMLEKVGDESEDAGEKAKKSGADAEKGGDGWDKFGGVLKGVAAAAGAVAVAAGAAAVKIGKEVVAAFGELEQNLGGSEAVFGEYAESIQKTGEDAYKNLGVSQSEYLATANKMGALFQGSGIEQQKSLELTEKAMQRAADMASVMGIDMQVALDSVAGAAKGNFTMMDNLGVAMNATNIEAYALAKGLDFTWNKATQAEKAEMAMQMFFESTQQYAGNFAKESTQTITGSIGMLKAALGSFTAGLGNANADMTKLTGNIVDAFKAVVANVMPIIQNLTAALPAAFAAMMPALQAMLPELLSVVAGLFQQVLEMLLEILPELIPIAVNAILTIVDTLIDNIDMLIDAAIEIIVALANGLVSALPRLTEKVPEIIIKIVETLANNLPMIIGAALDIIIALASGLIQAIPELLKAVPEIIVAIVKGFGSAMGAIINIGEDIVKGVWEGIKSMATWIKDKVSGFFSGIVDGVKGFLGIKSPSRVFAEIGENMAAGLGKGFGAEMQGVAKQINDSVPTSFNSQINATAKMGEGIVNGMAALIPQGGVYNINLMLPDGTSLANILFDPLKGVIKQRGVALA